MLCKIFSSSGGAYINNYVKKSIRLARYGCANRPFYHIVLMQTNKNQHSRPIEQLGTFDPMPNERNEKLVALNFERIQYWLGQNAELSGPVAELIGLSGFLPVHPRSYMTAWRNRHKLKKELEKLKETNQSDENK